MFQVHLLICCFSFLCSSSRFAVPHRINSNTTSFQISRRDHAFGRCLAIPYVVFSLPSELGDSHYLHGKFIFINMYHMPFKCPCPPTGRTRTNQQVIVCGFLPKCLFEPQFNDLRHSSDNNIHQNGLLRKLDKKTYKPG